MRTTIILPDDLNARVRERARAEGRTFTSYLEAVLRRDLAQSAAADVEEDSLQFIAEPFHGTGVRPGVDVTSNAALQDVLDDGVPIEQLR